MTTLKKTILASAIVAASTSAMAGEEFKDHLAHLPEAFSAEVDVAWTTDYRFRGISNSDRDPAVQGGFAVTHDPSNIYVGAWGSSVDSSITGSGVEYDYFVGYAGEHKLDGGKTLDYDIHYVYYDYPGNSVDNDYQEVGFSVGMGYKAFDMYDAHGSIGYEYSDDYANSLGNSHYTQINYTLGALPGALELSLHAGYSKFDEAFSANDDEYYDWSVGLGREIYGFDAKVEYVDTDINSDQLGGSKIADDTVLLTVSKSFSF